MDDSRRTFIVTGFIVVIVLAIIFIGIFYLIRAFQSKTPAQNTSNGIFPRSATSSPVPSGNPNLSRTQNNNQPTNTGSNPTNTAQTDPNNKIFASDNFQLTYPKGWGILTCGNSQNIELDPTNGVDNKNVACNTAVKPITILVDQTDPTGCDGETVKIGNYNVVKSKVGTDPEIDYRWCVQSSPTLDITHRVSENGGRATSATDYSTQIEKIISNLTFARGS